MSKNWIQSWSGKKVYPLHMKASMLDIRDQARALSMICRYGGHVDRFYSVAEHACRMHDHVFGGSAMQRWALVHDNAEAYFGDMPRPLKHQPEMKRYRDAEKRCSRLIFKWLGLKGDEPDLIKELDTEILGTETAALKAPVHPDWAKTTATGKMPGPWPEVIYLEQLGWSPGRAEQEYLARFRALWPGWL